MAEYRVLIVDPLTRTIRDEVPFSTFTYEEILDAPGSFSGNIGVRHPKAIRNVIDPARSLVYVERGGVIKWGGILWTAQPRGATLTVGAEGVWSYFRHRRLRETLTFVSTEQLDIARALVSWALAQSGSLSGVAVGSEVSGKNRDRTYSWWERCNIAEKVEQLAAVEDGFDFSMDAVVYELGGVEYITDALRLWYPRKGSRLDLVFELGLNVSEIEWGIDGTEMVNSLDAVGSGAETTIKIAGAIDATTLGTSYPLLDDAVVFSDIDRLDTLAEHARAELQARRLPVETFTATLTKTPDLTLGTFTTGDTVRFIARDGYYDIDTYVRITAVKVSVDEDGDEEITVTLAQEEAFTQ